MRRKYEISDAAYEWIARVGITSTERQNLMEDIRRELKDSANVRRFLSEVAVAAAEQGLGPVDCIALGINYGAAMILAYAMAQQRRSIV